MIKKIVILLIIISNIFLLSGCWNYSEIDKMSIVAGFAIDKGENGQKYNLSAELVNIQGGEKASAVSSKVLEASGNTIFDALRNMISINPQKLYIGHCKVIIVSEELAREGIIPVLDVFLRDHELRITNDVLIAKNVKAKEILLQKSETPTINSYNIDEMLHNSSMSLSKSTNVQVYQLVNTISTKGISSTLPAIKIEKINNKDVYKLDGIAIFLKDKLLGFLNDEESKDFLFIVNKIKGGTITTKIEDNKNLYISGEIFKSKTNVKHEYENTELSVNIETETIIAINDIGAYTNYADINEYIILEKQFKKQLQGDIKSLISKVQNDFGCDIFGFGKSINENDKALWEKYKSNWNETFKTLKVNVDSKIIIRSSGSAQRTIKIGE
ncbi:MAG: Ger(x)C family spore germination protein [Oscillospiraceae bacterium]